MIQQEINLNLIPSSEPVVVHCNQYDEGKSRIIAHLFNGSNPYTPSANATVKVQGTKPDNHAYQYWCEISGSTVTIDVNQQMTAVAGRVPSQLIVNETTGLTGSFAFYLDVQESTLPSNIDISETDIPILTEEAQEAAQRAIMAAASAQDSADDAAAWSSNPPYIGLNKNWYVYDITTEQFVDSGICAEGIGIDNIAKTATVGLIDTYTITYTDGNIQDYYVTNGADGNKWYKGTAISGGSSSPTVFPSSGITKANHNDFYLNTTEGAIYHCDTGGDASTATWEYDFTLTGGGSGGVTNYNDLTNKPQINGVTLNGNQSTSDLGINSGNVILSSIMHIGGQTQNTTQEALEALNNKDSGGSFIKVTTPDASFYGDTLTLSDGTTTLTTAFDSSGNAEFNGVMLTGTLTLATGSITRQIEVPYFGNYAVTISLWSATIAITTDSVDLYGETVTVKDSLNQTVGTATISAQGTASVQVSATGTYTVYCSTLQPEAVVVSAQTTYFVTFHLWTATLSISTTSTALYGKTVSIKKGGTTVGTTAFSSGGTATYRVHETGTYTAECEGYLSGDIVVSAETTYNATIESIPDGSTVTPTDDIQTWLACAAIDKAYTTLSDVLADHETLYQLMSDDNAVDYLVRSTTWASDITADATAMKYIGRWNYCSDTLLDDSTWCTSIFNSTYFEEVLNTKVPILAADSPNVIKSSEYGGTYMAWKAFDGSAEDGYAWFTQGNVPQYIGYVFSSAFKVKGLFLQNRIIAEANVVAIKDFKIQGSNDGFVSDEHDIESFTNPNTSSGATYRTAVTDARSNTDYSTYRIYISTAYDSRGMSIGELQFYGRQDVTEGLIDVYSAASDTVYYMDNGSPVTVCTTDASGHGTVSKSNLPNGTYTLYSSVAKDPNNLSNDYSKSITITDSTNEIYVMPDNAYYWYGNELTAITGGWAKTGYKSYGAYTNVSDKGFVKNTNNIYCDGTADAGGYDMPVLGVQNLLDLSNISKINIICNITAAAGNLGGFYVSANKDPVSPEITKVLGAVGTSLSMNVSTTSAYLSILNYFASDNRFIGYVYAIYGE